MGSLQQMPVLCGLFVTAQSIHYHTSADLRPRLKKDKQTTLVCLCLSQKA